MVKLEIPSLVRQHHQNVYIHSGDIKVENT